MCLCGHRTRIRRRSHSFWYNLGGVASFGAGGFNSLQVRRRRVSTRNPLLVDLVEACMKDSHEEPSLFVRWESCLAQRDGAGQMAGSVNAQVLTEFVQVHGEIGVLVRR